MAIEAWPEHLLDGPQVGPAGQQVGGEAVPSVCGLTSARKSAPSRMLLDDPPEADPRERPAGPRDQDGGRLGMASDQVRAIRRRDKPTERVDRPRAERDPALLVPLADAPGQAALEVEVGGPQPDDLRGPAAGRVEGLERRPVATAQPRVRRRASSSSRSTAAGPSTVGRRSQTAGATSSLATLSESLPSKTRNRKNVERLARCRQMLLGARPACTSSST